MTNTRTAGKVNAMIRTRVALISLVYLAALGLYILAGAPLVPFHGDEATQIYMSRDYAYQFLDRDLSRITYSDPPLSEQEQFLRLINGSVNKYLIGAAWHAAGFSVDDLNEQWDWGASWDYNQQTNHAPSDALLRAARWPSALLLALGLIPLFLLGKLLGGDPTAYLVTLYYALNPTLLLNGRRAMMEGGMIAFTLLALLAAIWLLRRRTWPAALGFGAAAGLALASKHTALFVVLPVGVGCALGLLIAGSRRGHLTRAVGLLLAAALTAALVFLGLNPVWWGDLIARAGEILAEREALLVGQTSFFGGYASAADALAGFVRQVLIGSPQYFEVAGWEVYLADQIAAYEASPWAGVQIGAGGWAVLMLALIGAAELVRARGSRPEVRGIIGLWALAALLSALLLTPLEWGRYYLPALPVVGLLAAFGLTRLFGWITDRRRPWRAGAGPSSR